MLIGNDWMKSSKVIVDFKSDALIIDGYRMPVHINNKSISSQGIDEENYIARAVRDTIIPPSTCQPMGLSVNEDIEGDILVESLPGASHGLLVPAAVHVSFPCVYQMVYNYSNAEIRIPAGTPMAVVSECDKITTFRSGEDVSAPEVKVRYAETTTTANGFIEDIVKDIPDHLKNLFKDSAVGLDESQCYELKDLLIENQDVFSRHDLDLGRVDLFKHPIPTGDARPFRDKQRRIPLKYMDREREHVKKLKEGGLIRHSTSPWAFNSVIVQKRAKEGTPAHLAPIRYAIDYRELNKRTVFDAHPLPSIETLLQCVAGSNWMSSLDLTAGFWQLEIEEEDKHKTAFYCSLGLMEWVVTPFGLQNAPASFQRLMTLVLGNLNYEIAACYIDDIVIFSKTTFQQHLINLRKVFRRLRKHNLKVKPDKCSLLKKSMKFLGKIVSETGVSIDPKKLEAISEWTRPKSAESLRRALGFFNYSRDFCPKYAEITSSLYDLMAVGLANPNKPLQWTDEHERDFAELKKVMLTTPGLGFLKPEGKLILKSDSSKIAAGACLYQMQEGKEVLLGCFSKKHTPVMRKSCATVLELCALTAAVHHFRTYLQGNQFELVTDHHSLVFLFKAFKHTEGKLARIVG